MNEKDKLEEILNETLNSAASEEKKEKAEKDPEKTSDEKASEAEKASEPISNNDKAAEDTAEEAAAAEEKNEEASAENDKSSEAESGETLPAEAEAPKPKPLRSLKRINTGRTVGGVNALPSRRLPKNLKPIEHPMNTAGIMIAEESAGYSPWVDIAVKAGSIILSLCIICILILNMPICLYKKNGDKKRVSILKYIDLWQPLSNIEGDLDKTNVDLNIDTDKLPEDYDDGYDLDQLVEGQYTVLFLGFEPDECNTDIIWICQFDIKAKKLRILQVPRDTAVPDFTSSPTTKFNSIYSLGDPSINVPVQRVVNAVQQNFGIPIDAYITTKCNDIEQIIDLIGGVPITLDNQINFSSTKIIPAGDSVLNGEQSVWFMRYRKGWLEGDIGRVQNQRRFMAAAMKKMLDITNDEGITKIYGYIKEIYDKQLLATDMTVGDMRRLANFCGKLSMDKVQVDMIPGEGTTKDNPYIGPDGVKYSIYSVHRQETINLLNKYYRPYQRPLMSSDVVLAEFIKDHTYDNYDNKTETFDNLLDSKEPMRG